jgi:3',5'-cyclic-AMP phosphodiesterase
MYRCVGNENRFFTCCISAILILIWFSGNGQSATLYEQSLQKLESRMAGLQKEPFTFVVMGDSRGNDPIFVKCLLAAARYYPEFIIHTGDAVSTGSEKQFLHFLALLQQTLSDIPVFVAAGNHELTNGDKSDKGKVLFQKLIGPLDYVLNLSKINARCIVLDNSGYSLESKQIAYLKTQLCAENSLNFVFMHIPPQTPKWIDNHTFTTGADAFLQMISSRNVAVVFYGHYHLYDESTISGTRHIITGGGGAPLSRLYFGEASYHFVVVTLSGGDVTTEKVLVSE